ncbi:MAG: hypothetical protein KAS67_06095 [Thermoplasmata archaeon]|nr:hypothetical protein [Thermoplasmata archaeon]
MLVKIKKLRISSLVLEKLARKHSSMKALSKKVSISKCSASDDMEDLVVWKYLKQGAILEEEIIFETPELFDTLTPKRLELIDYLANNQASSIKKLSEALHRNYKNTYDDLLALETFDIIEFIPSGKSKIPVCSLVSIVTVFED